MGQLDKNLEDPTNYPCTTVESRNYTARSRHGPANQLARQLVAAGFPDRPMVIRYRGLAGTMTYRSFHAAATWNFSEGER
jgi:hypothetical protein